ncbi:MAG: DUF4162 domain-containing protein, partial [candidate division Zixibacteria bacterium]|nr:DUF4162 domain-containing protein [candidate division Zixibacteria bacterium]
KIVAGGSPQQLKSEHIRNPMLEVECDNVIEAMEVLQREDWVVETSVFGTYIHLNVKEEEDAREKTKNLLEKHGIELKRIERIVPSLEDVFIHVVERG